MARPLLVNALELLRRPGTERDLSLDVPAPELELDDPRLPEHAVIGVRLHLESLTDGIVVRGALTAPFRGECRRCLVPVAGEIEVEVDELYQRELTDPDAFPIEHDQIDLEAVVREAVLLELPDAPLCRADCAGLCPVCGADRNTDPCGCDTSGRDERWSVLDQLRDQLPDA